LHSPNRKKPINAPEFVFYIPGATLFSRCLLDYVLFAANPGFALIANGEGGNSPLPPFYREDIIRLLRGVAQLGWSARFGTVRSAVPWPDLAVDPGAGKSVPDMNLPGWQVFLFPVFFV
jgi:hypothetical protein